jgi:ribonuclease T2
MDRSFAAVVLGLCLLAALPNLAFSQTKGQDAARNQPGHFDFYVLSLSWSPSFCAAAAERGRGRAQAPECGVRPYSFVVHGLWPQYEHGFPEYCQIPAPRLSGRMVSSMLDLMPAPHLIFNEWDRHGTCSGMLPSAYFETVRKARAEVNIPPDYAGPQKPLTVTPSAVVDAFVRANPGLAKDDIAIGCDKKRLTEVRFCLSKELTFRACAEVVKRSCRRDQILMPPSRGHATNAGDSG